MNPEMRIFFGVLCLAVAAFLAVLGGRWIRVYYIFEKYPKKTKKVGAILQDAEQKNNVRVGIRRPLFVKHMTKAVYAYTVDGQVYYIKATHYGTTKRQTPRFVPVVYITQSPKYAYIDDLTSSGELEYVLYGGVLLFCAMLLIFLSLATFGVIAS